MSLEFEWLYSFKIVYDFKICKPLLILYFMKDVTYKDKQLSAFSCPN